MKITYGFLVFSLVIVSSLAAPDWEAIKVKYQEIEANWRDHAAKAMEALKGELDILQEKEAENVLHDFIVKGNAFYEATVYKHIEEKNLTPQQVEEFRNKLTEIGKEVHKDFARFRELAKKEVQDKLIWLYEDSEKYRFNKTREVEEMLSK